MIDNLCWHGYILGSTDAVSAAVATELNSAPFIGFGRFGGTDRYDTAAIIANIGYDGMGMLWSRPALAVGTNFPDALAGGVLQGSRLQRAAPDAEGLARPTRGGGTHRKPRHDL